MNLEALASDWTAFHTPESERRKHVPEAIDRSPLLDRRSEPHPILNMLMNEALMRIMLVSDGAVTRLRFALARSAVDSRAPTSDLAAIIDSLSGRYVSCKTHRGRMEVIKEAQTTADRLTYSPKGNVLFRGTREWREEIAKDPRPRRVVAADYRVSPKTITAARKEFGRG